MDLGRTPSLEIMLPGGPLLQSSSGLLLPAHVARNGHEPRQSGLSRDLIDTLPGELAVLPARDGVLFPGMTMPAAIVGEPWVQLLDEAATQGAPVAIVAQVQPDGGPQPSNLYRVGTAARIAALRRLPNGAVQVLLQGIARIRILEFTRTEPYPRAAVLALPERTDGAGTAEIEALRRTVLDLFAQVARLSPAIPESAADAAAGIDRPGTLADFCANAIDLPVADRQQVLEALDPGERLKLVATYLERELLVLELGHKTHE